MRGKKRERKKKKQKESYNFFERASNLTRSSNKGDVIGEFFS